MKFSHTEPFDSTDTNNATDLGKYLADWHSKVDAYHVVCTRVGHKAPFRWISAVVRRNSHQRRLKLDSCAAGYEGAWGADRPWLRRRSKRLDAPLITKAPQRQVAVHNEVPCRSPEGFPASDHQGGPRASRRSCRRRFNGTPRNLVATDHYGTSNSNRPW